MIIITALYLFILALVFALVEIEIEGRYGWAEKLPTWYKKSGLSQIFSKFNSKKPLTGYHLFMLVFLFLIFHLGFFSGLVWTLAKELQIISYFIIFLTAEDFLWFVFNPYYGIKCFKKDRIWWHYDCKWFFRLFPLNYVYAVVISIVLNYFSSLLQGNIQLLYQYLLILIIIMSLILLASLLLPSLYKNWYNHMRKQDERKDVGIFH